MQKIVYNTTMNMIYKLTDVCKEYTGEYNVFNYLNIAVPRGISTGLLGEKWSGKSTLMAMLAGVEDYAGSIVFNNNELSNTKSKDANIGYIAEDFNFFKRKSAYHNLVFPMKIRKFDEDKINCFVESCLKYIEFDIDNKITQLNPYQSAQIALFRLFSVPRNIYLIDGLFDNDERYSEVELSSLINLYNTLLPSEASVVISAEKLTTLNRLNISNVAVLAYSSITDYGDINHIKEYPNTLASYKILHSDYKIIEAEVIDRKLYINNDFAGIFELQSDVFDNVVIAYHDCGTDDNSTIDFNRIANDNALVYDAESERLISIRN